MVTVLRSHLGKAPFPSEVSFVVDSVEDQEAFERALRREAASET